MPSPSIFRPSPRWVPCPKCGSNVYEHGRSFVCEKSVGPNRSCDFRSGKIILQQEIAAEQMRKLLAEGKTDLLLGFVSSRTRRKFKAFLVRGADGKIGFEFTPRPEKSKAGAAGKGAAKASMTRPRTLPPSPRRVSGQGRARAATARPAGKAQVRPAAAPRSGTAKAGKSQGWRRQGCTGQGGGRAVATRVVPKATAAKASKAVAAPSRRPKPCAVRWA